MDTVSIFMFALAFGMAVIFMAFAINLKRPEWAFLSGITWWTLAFVNLAVSTSNMFIAFTWLYFAVGFVLWIYGFWFLFNSFSQKKREKESELFTVED